MILEGDDTAHAQSAATAERPGGVIPEAPPADMPMPIVMMINEERPN